MNETILRALANASVDGQFAFDRDRRVTFWNDAMASITGLPSRGVVGRVVDEAFSFLGAEGEAAVIDRVLQGERCASRDRRYCVPETGREGWVDTHYAPLRDAEGEIVGGVVVVRETTESTLREARIAETELRFHNMANASPVLLWMSGTDSLCTFFNQTWLSFTGRSLEEEWGVGWAEGVHFEDLQRCLDTYEQAFSARHPFEMEYRLRRADGEFRWILDRGTPRYEPGGAFAGYIGSCMDITDRRALESELRAKLVLRDEFLGIASHELRTPLTALRLQIDGLLRLYERGRNLDEADWGKRVATTRASVERLESLISRLLDVSRMRAGGPELEPTSVDLVEVVQRACERLRDEIERAGSTLRVETPSAVVGQWDTDRLDQVVVNLLANAAKYGAGKPIHVHVDGEGGEARIVVRDEGIGIAEGDRRRIFERFERAASSSSFGGFGLGLWISNEIVKASGGRIDVDSAPGAGATFTVKLPRGPS